MAPRDIFEIRSSAPLPIRVLIADAHPPVRAGWRAALGADPNMLVVGEAGDEQTALSLAGDLMPDVVVATESLGVAKAVRVCQALIEIDPAPGILLVLNEKGSWPQAVFAESGATQLAFNSQSMDQLRRAVREVAKATHNAERWSLPAARPNGGTPTPSLLSAREAAVVRMIAEGLTHREIASALRISSRTLQTYQARAMNKLELTSRAELMRYAIARGWLEPTLDAISGSDSSEE